MSRLVAVTGASYSGKTTLVTHLADRGYDVVPEAAMQIIDELTASMGLEPQRAWRRADATAFQALILERQLANEAAHRLESSGGGLVFCDRGLVDGVAYCEHFDAAWPAGLAEFSRDHRYDSVVLLQTLRGFLDRDVTGRSDTREDAIRLGPVLESAYCRFGYEAILIEESPIEERVEAVLAALGTAAGPR